MIIAEGLDVFFMDNFKVFITVVVAIIGAYAALGWKHLESKFRNIKDMYLSLKESHSDLIDRIQGLEQSTHEMETNYIGRFGDIHTSLATTKEEIVENMYKMERRIKDDLYRLFDQKQS